jgi:hypothetical protein
MIDKPVKVPQKEITSVDVTNFGGGGYLNGAQNAPVTAFTKFKDVELTLDGYLIPRRKLIPYLPDTVETTYQKYPVLWEGELFHFTLDEGKAKFCQEGDDVWVDCGGADNDLTTLNGGMPKFIRVLNNVLILNGKNGDRLAYIDLSTSGFPVVKYTLVADGTTPPTAALTGLAAGAHDIYYAFNYSGAIGQTAITSPVILTQSINFTRDQWTELPTTPGSIELTRTGSIPTGARYWNVYVAIAAPGGIIQPEDMLLLAGKLDLGTDKFVDNGTLAIQLDQLAPTDNGTEGPRVEQGIVADGNPVLFADQDNPYAIHIGGGGPNAMLFSVSDGGYKAEPEKGTNFYPTTIIGFRTGQGVPALTVLYSNTEGLSKQAVLQQQTISYGDQSFTVWGVTEQHQGAAGVAAPNSAINYNGKLLFLSTDGFMSMETQPSVQNVISTHSISGSIDEYVRSIRNSAMNAVVGAGWNNKYMWLVPNAGFDTPRQILILDTNNKGVDGNGAWDTLNIPAQWIGVVSPQTTAAFVYICQGNKTYKLVDSSVTFDVKGGVNVPFSTYASGPLIGISGAAHNTWQANVQTMFYIIGLIGDVELGLIYRNQNGRLKTKSKIYHGPPYTPSGAGGWGDTQWTYGGFPAIPGWGASPAIDDSVATSQSQDVRIPVRVDDIINEGQWFIRTPVGFNYFKLRAVSLEGINLGVRPDLQ